ncbi:MAG: FUSC family protein [Bacteroidetes bacterium]|nr:FUSC family protein [Bacteroidota bacterium]
MIDYIKAYKKYSTSYYVSEGIRTTAGVMIPILVASYFGELQIGVSIALGAMCVGLTDNTGPIHHRVNGMVSTILLVFIISLLTGFCIHSHVLLAAWIAIVGFCCAFIGVFGTRASSVGSAGLLIMVLSIDERQTIWETIHNALLISGGGLFYLMMSLLIYRLRPYKLIQQALGDALISTGNYMQTRARFYEENVDYDATYKQLLEEQVQVHNKQNLVREMLFKTRDIVRESTHTSRILMMIFLDSVDLFERIMTSQQDYKKLHALTDDIDLLPAFRQMILSLAAEAENIGLSLQQGKPSVPNKALAEQLAALDQQFTAKRAAIMNDNNIEAFITLRHILESIKDIHHRLQTLNRYTSFDSGLSDEFKRQVEYSKFVSPSEFNLKLLTNNISIHSNIFRHSIRVSLALLAGFFISHILPFGHGYWVLLTIIVILKPAYSLTKQRNVERLLGTLGGAVIGGALLWFVRDQHVLLLLMIFCMVFTYSMLRVKYLPAVVAMTIYILIAFHFLKPGDFTLVLRDRLIDTFVGSAIAFVALIAIPPKWEHEHIQELLMETIRANAAYLKAITKPFLKEPLTNLDYKLTRKEVFVRLANLSDAFQRMLNEPKRQQKKGQLVHQMVVSNHMLASHIATLSSYRNFAADYASENFRPIIDSSLRHLDGAAEILATANPQHHVLQSDENFQVRDELQSLLQLRLQELAIGSLDTLTRKKYSELTTIVDQFEYINKISTDIEKRSVKLLT